MAIEVSHAVKSDIGLKRSHNEDCFLADPALGLYVVCDGMGGGNAGEIASAIAVESIHRYLAAPSDETAGFSIIPRDSTVSSETRRLVAAIQTANEAIHRAAWADTRLTGMGTTVVAAQIFNNVLSFAHVGDSRLYLIRHEAIQALTADHSWVAEQVRQGHMTSCEAEYSPKRNIVTRALGIESDVEVDAGELVLRGGDRLLLCSDGLTREVKSAEILGAIGNSPNITDAVDRLIVMANTAGGDDNTTVLIVAIQSGRLWHRVKQGWFPKAS